MKYREYEMISQKQRRGTVTREANKWGLSAMEACLYTCVCVCVPTMHVLLKWCSQTAEPFYWTLLQLPTFQMFPFGDDAAAGQML